MWLLILLISALFSVDVCMAFEDEAFKLAKHEYMYTPEYTGKQRYSEAQLRNDPEVLVANSHKELRQEFRAKPEDSVITVKEDKPIIVKTQFCDNNGCGEWKEQ